MPVKKAYDSLALRHSWKAGEAQTLNLSKMTHWDFISDQYERAEVTKKSAPKLFRALSAARTQGSGSRPKGITGDALVPMNAIVSLGFSSEGTFASAFSAIPGGTILPRSSSSLSIRRMARCSAPPASLNLGARTCSMPVWYFYKELYLKRELAQGTLGWPVIGVFVGHKVVSMGNGIDTPRGRCYDFPAGVEAFNMLALEMHFAGLEIANYQNASSQLQVVRNANLSALAATRLAFVYQTQWFTFPSLVSPLLSWRDLLPIGNWTTDPVTNPLAAVFAQLFGAATNDRIISCGIRYDYELAVSGQAKIVPYLPVKFRPKFSYDLTVATGTVEQIIKAGQSWYGSNHPSQRAAHGSSVSASIRVLTDSWTGHCWSCRCFLPSADGK